MLHSLLTGNQVVKPTLCIHYGWLLYEEGRPNTALAYRVPGHLSAKVMNAPECYSEWRKRLASWGMSAIFVDPGLDDSTIHRRIRTSATLDLVSGPSSVWHESSTRCILLSRVRLAMNRVSNTMRKLSTQRHRSFCGFHGIADLVLISILKAGH